MVKFTLFLKNTFEGIFLWFFVFVHNVYAKYTLGWGVLVINFLVTILDYFSCSQ